MEEVRALLRTNLEKEAESRDKQKQEIAVMNELVKNSNFDDIPDVLLTAETHKMLHELQSSIERQNLSFDDYLSNIKKKKSDLLLEFSPEAVKRVKSAVLIREIAKKEQIEPKDSEVIEEQTKMLNVYKDDTDTQERVRSDEGLSYIRMTLRNRKVIKFLTEKIVKQ